MKKITYLLYFMTLTTMAIASDWDVDPYPTTTPTRHSTNADIHPRFNQEERENNFDDQALGVPVTYLGSIVYEPRLERTPARNISTYRRDILMITGGVFTGSIGTLALLIILRSSGMNTC